MPFYTKPISQLDTTDLQELLTDVAVENLRLEFKLKVPDKDDTLKKLSSFANTLGGFMVIGAEADKDGRITGLPGVEVEPSYKQKIVDWCSSAVNPPFYVEVSNPIPAPTGNEKVCYVIYVAESETAPHFLNGRRGVWVRTDEFLRRFEAQLATELELRHLFDRRKLVQDRRANLIARAKKRFDVHAAKLQTAASGIRNKPGPLLEFCVVPRFPARQLCQQIELLRAVQASFVQRRGTTFTDQSATIISQHESIVVLNAARSISIFEVNVWGMLLYGIYLESDVHGTSGIGINRFIGSIQVFILHAANMFRALGYSGPILIDVALRSILGAKWVQAWMGFPDQTGGSALDDELSFAILRTTDDLRERPDGILMDVLRKVFSGVDLLGYASNQENLENLVRKGYEFNGWKIPQPLCI